MSYEELKKSRGVSKGKITRLSNRLRQVIAEDEELGLVPQIVADLKAAFVQFSDTHEKVKSHSENAETESALEEYFLDVQAKYIDALSKAKGVKENIAGRITSFVEAQDLASFCCLPRLDLSCFDGNPLEYFTFIKSFDASVDKICSDHDAKLARLLQYTKGEPHQAILSCLYIGGQEGYKKARSILKDLYGCKHRVTEQVIKTLRKSKPVRTANDMRELSHELRNAYHILESLDSLSEADAQVIIFDIITRLPNYVQNNWTKEELKSKRDNDCYLDFKSLMSFVERWADQLSDPLVGYAARSERQQRKKVVNANVIKSKQKQPKDESRNLQDQLSNLTIGDSASADGNATAGSQSGGSGGRRPNESTRVRNPCKLCSQRHIIVRCPDFRALKVQERITFVKSNRLCENCLRDNHTVSECTSPNRCFVCQQKHSAFIHNDQSSTNCATRPNSSGCYMPIVKVQVNDQVTAYAALDTLSSSSFCTKELSNRLGLKGQTSSYILKTMSGESSVSHKQVNFKLSSGSESMTMSGVKVVDEIPVDSASLDTSQYPHMSGIDLPANDCQKIDILIGQDFSDAMIPLEVRKGLPGQPFLVRYKFGWTVSGRNDKVTTSNVVICNYILTSTVGLSCESSDPVDPFIESGSFWNEKCRPSDQSDFESVGMSVLDKKVIDLWDNTCQKVEGHYQIPIPWKDPKEELPNNFDLAYKRLENLVKRLKREGLFSRYDEEISKLLESKYAEIVPEESRSNPGHSYYIPHHCVINVNKPGKMRIVFDCSSICESKSLNDRALQGPDLINKLVSVLLRFRCHSYCVTGDVVAMYNQVLIPVEQRDALRFLWFKDGELVHLRSRVHIFGAIWSSAAASYALRKTVFDHPNVDPLVKDTILNSFYVDDMTQSVMSVEDVRRVITGVPAILATGGFELAKFAINDASLMEEIPPSLRAKEVHEFSHSSVGRALGVKWHIHNDMFMFAVKEVQCEPVTRRSMLSFISSIFDPLGLITPWILQGKLLLQDVTCLKIGWDECVPIEVSTKWNMWISSLKSIEQLSFPRCVKPSQFDDGYQELHIFVDSSERLYGACIYVRCISKKGEIMCRLLMSKAHVIQKNGFLSTIPRKELQAAKIGALLYNSVKSVLNVGVGSAIPAFFWCDSNIVLGYIKNESRRFRVFVENRVNVIRTLTNPDHWDHVLSRENPSDLLTRPGAIFKQGAIKLWCEGPSWLYQHYPFWSKSRDSPLIEISVDDPEVRNVKACATEVQGESWLKRFIDHYSSWTDMIRAVAWIRRFVLYKKHSISGALTAGEIQCARDSIIMHIQEQSYSREVSCLRSGKPILKSSSIVCLNPFLDKKGLMRVGSRVGEHPVIIPYDSPVAISVIREFHEKGHYGLEWTFSLVRSEYWVVKGRRLVKRVLRNCVVCKILFAKPMHQIMSDLPRERISVYCKPFSYVGCDVFGPYMSQSYRSQRKRYGCIFTCMTTRAVHIEMLYSLEADSFICSLRRFLARRSVLPIKIFSDNGLNYVRSEKELKKAFSHHARHALFSYASARSIEWSFIPPLSPHQGGAWERLIGVIKRVFRAVLPKASHLSDEVLSTLFCEVEAIVNSRPLTKLSDDPNDHTPLTPNSLLALKHSADIPPSVGSPSDKYRSKWKYVQHLTKMFWSRWIKEYLPKLYAKSKWHFPTKNVKVGELVLVSEPGMPRNLWPLAIVKEVYPGRDGKVRSVRVKTRVTELHRPITRLVRLELDTEE